MSSQYIMTIHANAGTPGHFFIGVKGPGIDHTVRGFYPKSSGDLRLEKDKDFHDPNKDLTVRGPGELRDDRNRIKDGGVKPKEIILPNKEAAEKVLGHMKDVEANPGEYDLKNKNCINFAQSTLDKAGVDKSVADYYKPEELKKIGLAGLEARNDAQTKEHEEKQSLHDKEADRPWEDFRLPEKNATAEQKSKPEVSLDEAMKQQGRTANGALTEGNLLMEPEGEKAPDLDGGQGTIETGDSHGGRSVDGDDGDAPADTKSVDAPAPYWDEDQWDRTMRGLGVDALAPASNQSSLQTVVTTTPRASKKFIDMAKMATNGVEGILEKSPRVWTKEEVRKVQSSPLYSRPGPRQQAAASAVEAWYNQVYGDDEVQYDETGRMIGAEPKIKVSKKPVEARDVDGRSLSAGVERIARHLAAGAKSDSDVKQSVLGAQKAFNMLSSDRKLKEDGVFGPKSKSQLRDAVQRLGPAKVEEGLSLGRFANFANQVRKSGSASALASETERTFGPLLQSRAKRGRDWMQTQKPRPNAPKAKRPEAHVLQETVNELGSQAFGSAFNPVKEDGWIGPKTTQAFQGVASTVEPFKLTQYMARNFGFFDDL